MRHRPGSGRGSMNRVCTGCNLVGSRRNQVGRLGSHRHPATSTDLVVALPIRSTWAAVPPDSSCPRLRRLLRPGDRRRHSHSAQCTQPSIRQIPLAAALGDRRSCCHRRGKGDSAPLGSMVGLRERARRSSEICTHVWHCCGIGHRWRTICCCADWGVLLTSNIKETLGARKASDLDAATR